MQQEKAQQKKNLIKAFNYTLIIVLALSISYLAYRVGTVIVNEYDMNVKNEIGIVLIWCIVIGLILYMNL